MRLRRRRRPLGDELPTLSQFFGAYFHQDWGLDSESPDHVVDEYLRENSRETVDKARRELGRLLEQSLSEKQLACEALALGRYYDPRADGIPLREWLRTLETTLADGTR